MYQILIVKLQQIKKTDSIENDIKNLKTLDLSYFIGKSHFEEYDTQNYLVFKSLVLKYLVLK